MTNTVLLRRIKFPFQLKWRRENEENVSGRMLFIGSVFLTPSLPQPVKFLGWNWKLQRHTYKQYIFCTYNIYFQCYIFQWKSIHMPVAVRKRRRKQLRVSNFALLLVIFKRHRGSYGVKRSQIWLTAVTLQSHMPGLSTTLQTGCGTQNGRVRSLVFNIINNNSQPLVRKYVIVVSGIVNQVSIL